VKILRVGKSASVAAASGYMERELFATAKAAGTKRNRAAGNPLSAVRPQVVLFFSPKVEDAQT
jgi:hypothetical protein